MTAIALNLQDKSSIRLHGRRALSTALDTSQGVNETQFCPEPAAEQNDAEVPAAHFIEYVRASAYQPSGQYRVPAIICSACLLALVGAGLTLMTVVGGKVEHQQLTLTTVNLTPPPKEPPPPVKVNTPDTLAKPTPAKTKPAPAKIKPVAITTPTIPLDISLPRESTMQVAVADLPAAETVSAEPQSNGPATVEVSGGNLQSTLISARPPKYPMAARQQRIQGTVKLTVLVGTDGKVKSVSVAKSSGSDLLDHAALNAVQRWVWKPMIRDGAPVFVRGFVVIPFVLVKA